MNWKSSITRSSLATLVGLCVHFAWCYWHPDRFLTDSIAEWIMARTPSAWALPLLDWMGVWAKPFAATGGLATLGFILWIALLLPPWWAKVLMATSELAFVCFGIDYTSLPGVLSFLLPALLVLLIPRAEAVLPLSSRREFLTSAAMSSGTILVAVEAYWRSERFALRAIEPVPLFGWSVPAERVDWGKGLVRKPVTTVREFYVMSKNTVDPVVDPKSWRLKIRHDNRLIREFTYAELLSLPRKERFITMRCVSNTLKSDLMGTAAWSGIELGQLVRASEIPSNVLEMAVIGLDGHGDSVSLKYAFSGDAMFALGMNGDTLNRNHGFPVRMLAPSYYGFKSIKWIDEIRFSSVAYFGTWPKLGFTKEPLIHTASYVDRIVRDGERAKVGGVSFAGVRGVQRVEIRANNGEWQPVELEAPLSAQTLTRWKCELILPSGAEWLEARAMDGENKWQSAVEKPLFPDGVSGPTIKKLPGV